MASLEFTSVTAKQFKGFAEKSVQLYHKTDIIGANGTGKTTMGIAMSLPFTGKDLSGRKNPEIHPDSAAESEPTTSVSMTIDGKPITVELIQKDMRTKKQVMEGAPVRISNKYKVNGVDKTEKSMKADFLERGIDLDRYEELTNPNLFTVMKEADKRRAVFDLASDITDLDVANAIKGEVPALIEKLVDYRLDEIESMAKSQKKTASDRQKALPEQIIGAEKQKMDLSNIPALKKERKELETKLADTKAEYESIVCPSEDNLRSEINAIEMNMKLVLRARNDENGKAYNAIRNAYDKTANAVESLRFDVESNNSRLRRKQNDLDEKKARMERQLGEYNAMKEKTFPKEKSVCPTCGQEFPSDKVMQIELSWNESKSRTLSEMRDAGNKLAIEIKDLGKEMSADKANLKSIEVKLTALEQELDAIGKKLDSAKSVKPSDGSDIPEYMELAKKRDERAEQLKSVGSIKQAKAAKKQEVSDIIYKMGTIDRELANEEYNNRIDRNIAEMKAEQKTVAQNLADAEAILYQISLLNQKKNEMLSESVNSHFPEFLKFKLFDIQKNGEVRDCCIPLIKNENDEWKELGKSANQALEMRAKLAILEGFQNFYDLHLPIIVDGASEIDTENKKRINLNTQVIFLTVRDDAPLTVEQL